MHFQEYARRVRELHTRSDVQISPSVWIFFARRCPDGHSLVPRLQRLDAFDACSTEPGKILLLSPTLRHLALTIHAPLRVAEGSPVVDTVMELVQKISVPHLESLRLTATAADMPFNYHLMPYARLAHLRELDIQPVCHFDKNLLQELLTFPHLRKLTVYPKFIKDNANPVEEELTPGFGALRDLTVIGDPATVAQFLRRTSPPSLESLAARYTDWLLDVGVSESAMLSSIAAKSLRRLSLTFASYLVPQSLLEVIRPILELNGMTHISFAVDRLEMELPVSDTELRTMAGAWPNLVEFGINVKEVDGGEDVLEIVNRPSPQSLVLFAERHPHLVRLVWPYVDMAAAPDLQAIPALNHGLQVFRSCIVQHNILPKHREFAAFVDHLFPNLDLSDVQYSAVAKSHYGRQRYKNWCDVEQFLLAIHAGRRSACRS